MYTLKGGYGGRAWWMAIGEARGILGEIARNAGTPLSYHEVAERIVSIRFHHWSALFHRFLDELSIEENAAGRRMLSVLVVHGYGTARPRFLQAGPRAGTRLHQRTEVLGRGAR